MNDRAAAAVPPAAFPPVAIVGVGMRAPGGIDDLESLWKTLVDQRSIHAPTFTDPLFRKRFDIDDAGWQAMFNVTPDARNTLHSSLLDETPGLDEDFFGVSARESACMDVQQKLLLHVAYEALEDAGYDGGASGMFNKKMFGVYVGASTDDFEMDPHAYEYDIYHLARNQRAFLAGQITHRFGFEGPSVAVDTVCASAMTAVHDACRALLAGECDTALAGGVHVMSPISSPPTVMALKLAGFLDPTGQCKPFMANGRGYCRAEGCGLAVLKRFEDAVRDGDRILGIIRGVGVGNMASSKSIHRPDGKLQSIILDRALRMSGLCASDITFVEAHGPGTQAGDPAELESVSSVLGFGPGRKDELIIGSIKGNIGHSEAASAMLSIFKVLAMMRHQSIPAQPNFDISDLNPKLRPFLDGHPIRIADCAQPWSSHRKIAVVNNFGASGYAGSLIVESPTAKLATPGTNSHLDEIPRPFLLSAKDPETLLALRRQYIAWLQGEGTKFSLRDLSFSTTARCTVHAHHQLFVAASVKQLVDKLSKTDPCEVPGRSSQSHSLGFCFSGQGGPALDPRRSSLYGISSAFTQAVDLCYEASKAEQLVHEEDSGLLDLFALEHGLSCAWKSWGFSPSAVSGHSFGEYGALVCAGVLSVRDAIYLVGLRAALVRMRCVGPPSGMMALQLDDAERNRLLKVHPRVELACDNATARVTLAGSPEDLKALEADLRADYPAARWQTLSNMKVAFHSRFVEPLLEEFREACTNVEFCPLRTTFISTVLGKTCPPGDESISSEYFVNHCRNTVQFRKAMEEYHSTKQPDWIEIGPHTTTISFLAKHPVQLKVASHRKGHDEWSTMLSSLITLRSAGHSVDFANFNRDTAPGAVFVDLPRYPLRPTPHKYRARKVQPHPVPTTPSTSKAIAAEAIAPILEGHVVAGASICPASVYISLSLATSSSGATESLAFSLSNLTMMSPFSHLRNNQLIAQATPPSSGPVFSVHVGSNDNQVHASMNIQFQDDARLLANLSLLGPLVWKSNCLKDHPNTNVLDKRLAYALFGQTVLYGVQSRRLDRVWISENGSEAWAQSQNASVQDHDPTELQTYSPTLIDRACQLVGLLINTSPMRGDEEIFVASAIDSIEMSLRKIRASPVLHSYASFDMQDTKEGVTAVGQVYTFDEDCQLISACRGVRMRRMKREVLKHLVANVAGPFEHVSTEPAHSSSSSLPSASQPARTISVSSTREQVISLIESVLGMRDLSNLLKAPLCDIGLDSLTSIELQLKLERLFPEHKLEAGLLLQQTTTVESIINALSESASLHSPSDPPIASSSKLGPDLVYATMQTNPEVIQDPKKEGLPLILIHDGSGTTLAYHALGPLKRTVLGIHNPGFRNHMGIGGVQEQADRYADLIRGWVARNSDTTRTLGKVLVGGWSLGGLIATALAAAHNDLVAGVLLVDPPPPGTEPMQSSEVDKLVPRTDSRRDSKLQELVREQLSLNSRALTCDPAWLARVSHLLRSLESTARPPMYLISALEPLNHTTTASRGQPLSPGSCSEWMISNERTFIAEKAWNKFLGDQLVGTMTMPGDHFTIFAPQHIATTTAAILEGADALQAAIAVVTQARS